MNHLPIESQLAHQLFCQQVAEIHDINIIKRMLTDIHFNYLVNQTKVAKIAKDALRSLDR